MVQTKGLKVWHTIAEALACGRTLAEQEETIRRYGNHGLTPVLRAGLLAALGLPKPSAAAENCIIFGCYRPFTTPFLVKDYIRLLDILNIEYTYLEDEMCCGAPLAMLANDEERPAIMTVGEGFNQHNLELARQKGAKRQAYCCAGCVHAARNTFPVLKCLEGGNFHSRKLSRRYYVKAIKPCPSGHRRPDGLYRRKSAHRIP